MPQFPTKSKSPRPKLCSRHSHSVRPRMPTGSQETFLPSCLIGSIRTNLKSNISNVSTGRLGDGGLAARPTRYACGRLGRGLSCDDSRDFIGQKQSPYERLANQEGNMRNVPDITMLEPAEIADLQSCFDAILGRRRIARSSEEAGAIARGLMLAYQRGVVDRNELIRLADVAIDDQTSEPSINKQNQ